jgi:hypothetical protein
MACDTKLRPRQTIQERAKEVREAVTRLAQGLAAGRIRLVIDPATGAPAFAGWEDTSKDGVSDACSFRILAKTGSPMFIELVRQAQALAGRAPNTHAGMHAHVGHGGKVTWHHDH